MPFDGWFTVSGIGLVAPMMKLAPKTILCYIKTLVKNGWLEERSTSKFRCSKTKQWKLRQDKITADLVSKGYRANGAFLS
ncbi:hypothetical protein [Evansella cellulosilytica]|uniref:Uncharacterized protein n=1 Tax=Evansella cellulosilytica (strain ATCC 21833 / DSM 2522 / FERM P-1141 / JCM 9156 / N-4) TaxID=649639 RepID=E6TTX3_EVAC2|nr:hypothetical protein [Evansella cellulosilytica]ADU32004.1 hypothetical protein Bcell_3764 [Evansella cellulosilytica DSM 2522]